MSVQSTVETETNFRPTSFMGGVRQCEAGLIGVVAMSPEVHRCPRKQSHSSKQDQANLVAALATS